MKLKLTLLSLLALMLPAAAHAQTVSTFSQLVDNVRGDIINPLLLLVMAIGVVVFLYGVGKYVNSAGDEARRTEGRQFMIWGIIALFVMASVLAIVQVIRNTLKLREDPLRVPSLPTSALEQHRG